MTNEYPASTSYLSVAWPPFAQKLAAALEKLEEDQFLILSVKRSNRFIQFAAQGSFGMRVETTSNSYLAKPEQLNERQIASLIDAGWHDPTGTPPESTPEGDPDGSPNFFVEFSVPVSFEAVANLTVRTLAGILRVPYPGTLQYEAFDEHGKAIDLPGLGLKQAKRRTEEESMEDVARQLVSTLRGLTGISDLDFDENGCINICAGSLPIFVAIAESQSYIRVGSPIHSDLSDTSDVLVFLNNINAGIPVVHFYLRDETVYGVVDIPALPFVAEHIVHAIGQILKAAEGISKMLHEQFGGRSECCDWTASSTNH